MMRRIAITSFLAVLGMLFTVNPAQAAPVYGSMMYFPALSANAGGASRSNVARLWQMIVWADIGVNYRYTNTKMGCAEFADGDFGSWTKENTKLWQAKWRPYYGNDTSGSVGPQSWGIANNRLGWKIDTIQAGPDFDGWMHYYDKYMYRGDYGGRAVWLTQHRKSYVWGTSYNMHYMEWRVLSCDLSQGYLVDTATRAFGT